MKKTGKNNKGSKAGSQMSQGKNAGSGAGSPEISGKNSGKNKSADGREDKKTEVNFILLTLFVLGIFAVIFFGIKVLDKPKIVTIDELHTQNIKGELDPDQGYMYKGFSFVYANGMWFTKAVNSNENRMYSLQLHYGPRQAENITVDGDINQFAAFNGTYITFDPVGADLSHVGMAAGELSIASSTFFNKLVVAACTKNETEVCSKREIVNCENNNQNPIIYMEEATLTKIVQDGNCIRIQGNGFELARAVDKLIYTWMGIM
ncbi:hypothetical protein COV19_07305 [Candidatus Woesearchaeota archaeon CG10_big_fil_rev_8_21_14_0_10_44_13]|nr:MAG: hypothetical protein COV19_07305 [Candidatus Woesearchaeota archaeon CG10_big_fil_rev_8_21_14_0_10_44_13]